MIPVLIVPLNVPDKTTFLRDKLKSLDLFPRDFLFLIRNSYQQEYGALAGRYISNFYNFMD